MTRSSLLRSDSERKFTPPTEFPAEYVDGYGNKVVILGRSNHKGYPLIGFDHTGCARAWSEYGTVFRDLSSIADLHDREDWDELQEVTAELEQAEARIEELEAKLKQEIKETERLDRVWSDNYAELEAKLTNQTHMIAQVFALLDVTEETEDGRVFHPTQIRSSRVLDAEKLNALLAELRDTLTANNKENSYAE